ncbi:HU family DNA-binding protein [Skeletonema marinoi]|uniref:HU family DNA-binding protein n=1 Tax=Skeletonema marinoi TaxID=267567 RepID=A0AAD9DGZ4_9STRA|nr:HU family DNA-binding protein [Skeletonema marinoi]
MTSSFHHLSRSAALHISRKHCLRPAVSSVAPFRSYSSGFGGNHGFSTVTSNAPKDNGPVLSKADLAQIISAEHDLKMAESNRIIDTLLDTIVEAVSKEGTVSVAGFGKFFNKKLEARDYRNPSTGETVFKGDRKVPKFKAFTNFKDCVEGTKSVKK